MRAGAATGSRGGSSVPRSGGCAGCGAAAPGPVPGHLVAEGVYRARCCRARRSRRSALAPRLPATAPARGWADAGAAAAGLSPRQLGPHPLRDRDAPHPEPPAPGASAQMCVKPRKSNVSGFPSPAACRSRAANRPNSISRVLPGCSSSPNFANRSRRSCRNRLGILPVLEPDDEVVREPHDDHVTARVPLPPPARPTGPRRSAGTRWRATAKPMPPAATPVSLRPGPVLDDPCGQPLADQPQDPFVRDPVPEELLQPVPIKLAERIPDLLRASMTSPRRSARGRRAGCPWRRLLSC